MSKKKCDEKIQSKVERMQNDDCKNWEQGNGSYINGFSFFFARRKELCGCIVVMVMQQLECT